jgi:hypothetical protein
MEERTRNEIYLMIMAHKNRTPPSSILEKFGRPMLRWPQEHLVGLPQELKARFDEAENGHAVHGIESMKGTHAFAKEQKSFLPASDP